MKQILTVILWLVVLMPIYVHASQSYTFEINNNVDAPLTISVDKKDCIDNVSFSGDKSISAKGKGTITFTDSNAVFTHCSGGHKYIRFQFSNRFEHFKLTIDHKNIPVWVPCAGEICKKTQWHTAVNVSDDKVNTGFSSPPKQALCKGKNCLNNDVLNSSNLTINFDMGDPTKVVSCPKFDTKTDAFILEKSAAGGSAYYNCAIEGNKVTGPSVVDIHMPVILYTSSIVSDAVNLFGGGGSFKSTTIEASNVSCDSSAQSIPKLSNNKHWTNCTVSK